MKSPSEITVLLRAWSEGDDGALARLTPLVYGELYRAARRYMAHQNPGHTLQSTALVNEVYLRLSKLGPIACTFLPYARNPCATFSRTTPARAFT
jgi:hypothetical protein